MQGMAKSAPVETVIQPVSSGVVKDAPQGGLMGVPEDVWAYFGVNDLTDRRDSKLQGKMQAIVSYMLDTNPESDLNSVLFDISRIEDKLGHPRLGVDRYDQVYQWITIQRQINSLQKKAKAYEK